MSYWGPCPTRVRLCPTYPHDVTPVAILQDGGLLIYSSSLTRGYVISIRKVVQQCHYLQNSGGPRNSNVAAGGFCPRKTQNLPGAYALHFSGGAIFYTLFFLNFGPGEFPWAGPDPPLLLPSITPFPEVNSLFSNTGVVRATYTTRPTYYTQGAAQIFL